MRGRCCFGCALTVEKSVHQGVGMTKWKSKFQGLRLIPRAALTVGLTLFGVPAFLNVVLATPASASVGGCYQQWYGHVGPSGYNTPSFTVESTCGGTNAYNFYTEDSSPGAYFRGWWYDNINGNWVEGTRGYQWTGSSATLLISSCTLCGSTHAQSESTSAYVYVDS